MSVNAAELTILDYPHPALRARAKPVNVGGEGAVPKDELAAVSQKMLELMREEEGIGLAGPQVGLSWRLFVIDIPDSEQNSSAIERPSATKGPVVYINPVLSAPTGAPERYEEGCLSLPDIRGEVLRPPIITVTALDLEGNQFTQTASGLLARCIQHEFDHLEGVLIIDKMTTGSRLRNKTAIRELEKSRR